MAFYTNDDLKKLGFSSFGNNVLISDKASIYGANRIKIGNNVRIDDFCILSAGESGIEIGTGPTVPDKFKNIISKPVFLGKHVIVGSGSVILPGVILQAGVAVGAMSLVNKSFDEFKIIGGIPAKILKDRNKNLLTLEKLKAN
jgi:acetyltransferase-like isoleucine patch superfamily enzyme